MPHFICPGCSSQVNVPEQLLGKKVRCRCGASMLTPAGPAPPPLPPVPQSPPDDALFDMGQPQEKPKRGARPAPAGVRVSQLLGLVGAVLLALAPFLPAFDFPPVSLRLLAADDGAWVSPEAVALLLLAVFAFVLALIRRGVLQLIPAVGGMVAGFSLLSRMYAKLDRAADRFFQTARLGSAWCALVLAVLLLAGAAVAAIWQE